MKIRGKSLGLDHEKTILLINAILPETINLVDQLLKMRAFSYRPASRKSKLTLVNIQDLYFFSNSCSLLSQHFQREGV